MSAHGEQGGGVSEKCRDTAKIVNDAISSPDLSDAEFNAAMERAKSRVLDGVEPGWFRDALIEIMDGPHVSFLSGD